MRQILVSFAHPVVERSRINSRLLDAIKGVDGVTITNADAPIVIAGYGRFGQIVGRILRANGFSATILDLDPSVIEMGETGIQALELLGFRAFTAQRLAQRWRTHEEGPIEEALAPEYDDDATYWARTRAAMAEAERLMRREDPSKRSPGGWDNESLRADAEPDAAAADEAQ